MTQGRTHRGSRWPPVVRHTLLVVALLLVVATVLLALDPHVGGGPGSGPARGTDAWHARQIVGLLQPGQLGVYEWPPYSGKNFVLAMVPHGLMDPARTRDRRMLFRVGYEPRGVGPDAYSEVTWDSLDARRFPHLTHWAGRRNLDPRFQLNPSRDPRDFGYDPVIGMRHDDGVLIGFANGMVVVETFESLGLRRGEFIHFGDKAKSDLLRCLSEE